MAEMLTRVPRVREDWSSNSGPAKSYTTLQTVRHRFNIYASNSVALALCWAPQTRYTLRGWAPQTRYTLRRNTVSIMKGLVWFLEAENP